MLEALVAEGAQEDLPMATKVLPQVVVVEVAAQVHPRKSRRISTRLWVHHRLLSALLRPGHDFTAF
jgi:hypothetical protein